jgi:ADP-ribose pyrophosphatase YjhB (NUDIX family)
MFVPGNVILGVYMDDPQWLTWATRLQAIAQTGLAYAKDAYDIERYSAVRRISAEMMAAAGGLKDWTPVLDLFSREAGYATPKVDVRAAVFRDDRVLLVKEREDGRWTLPGGWADVGDAPGEAAIREVKEESGFDVVPTKIAAVYDRNRHGHPPIPFHAYKLFFLCDIVRGEPACSHETEAVDFFAEDRLPPLSLTRVTPGQICHLFAHHRHPEWPTSFD